MRVSSRSIASILIFAGSSALSAAPRQVEGVAAVVGDEVILRSEVLQASRRVEERIEKRNGPLPPDARREVRRQALQMLIDQNASDVDSIEAIHWWW